MPENCHRTEVGRLHIYIYIYIYICIYTHIVLVRMVS